MLQKTILGNLAHHHIINTKNHKVGNIVNKIIQDDILNEHSEDIANGCFVDIEKILLNRLWEITIILITWLK